MSAKRSWWWAWCLGAIVGLFVVGYASYFGITWYRYGGVQQVAGVASADPLLDSFMPAYDVAGRQHVRVAAPAETTFAIGCATNPQQSLIVRSIFRARASILGAIPEKQNSPPLGLVDQAKAWGWGILAEEPGREIVFGSVTQPWAANPVFRALPPDEFVKFQEPGFVKIVWMLRVDPIGNGNSMVSTETRVATTDPVSRAKFRRYWSWASPGMFLIRWVLLREVRDSAEQSVAVRPPQGRSDTLVIPSRAPRLQRH